MDVACFVGLVALRGSVTGPPAALADWLRDNGWDAPAGAGRDPTRLLQVPVPLESWDAFDALFDWDGRPTGAADVRAGTALGAAVRTFFEQGGRRCYVVRAGEPPPLDASPATRRTFIGGLVPGFPFTERGPDSDRALWRGIHLVLGLPDVFVLSLPDLPDLVAAEPPPPDLTPPAPVTAPERFVECSEPQPAPAPDDPVPAMPAPRCDRAGYRTWGSVLGRVRRFLARHRRDVQLLASVPLPVPASEASRNLAGFLAGPDGLATAAVDPETRAASAFVQLGYPWIEVPAARMPGGVTPPEGAVVGVLARNALARGAFRSAASTALAGNPGVSPVLGRHDMLSPGGPGVSALLDMVSLLGPTPRGTELLSDVTTSVDSSYRPACVNRLLCLLLRAARKAGEEHGFESSGPRLWGALRARVESVLQGLFEAGALRGATAAEAFTVRCDESTTTPVDQDNGRVVATVRFQAAAPVEAITVVLALETGSEAVTLGAEVAA